MRKTAHRVILLMAVLCSLVHSLWAEQTPRQRLATEFIRSSLTPAFNNLVSVQAIQFSTLLAKEAVALDPENVELWNIALELAQFGEDEEFKARAIDALLRLDPANEVIRLMRINAALDRHQTIEARTAAMESLLSDANISRIGAAVASRLAMDLALMYQRQGEQQLFSQWLTKAITLDPSNRSAAAIATGFFRMNVTDPVAEAEMLINLLLTDPTDMTTLVALSQLLLDHGAFNAAQRMYRLTARAMSAEQRSTSNDLLADYATSLWGAGNSDEALELLHYRQVSLNDAYRNYIAQTRPELMRDQVLAMSAPHEPNMVLVAALIHVARNSPEMEARINQAIGAYDTLIADMKQQLETAAGDHAATLTESIPSLQLEQAWVILWLGGDHERAIRSLELAQVRDPLSESAQQRFNGWLALRRGNTEEAMQLLTPIATQDVTARAGLALALEQAGHKKDSARELLMIVRSQPGSLIGLWASHRLKDMLGQAIPPGEQAKSLEQLIASISLQFDRTYDDPSMAISFRIVPAKQTFESFEPILFNIELMNNTSRPLALDRNGPLRPQLLVVTGVRGADTQAMGDMRAFVLDIGRRLRLEPKQRLTITYDLRNYHPGDSINMLAVNGALIRLEALLNFYVTPSGAAERGLYGFNYEVPTIRMEGQRISEDWVRSVAEEMKTADPATMLPEMAMVSFQISARLPFNTPEERREVVEQTRLAWADAFAKLDEASQAWLLSVIPRGPAAEGMQPILAMAQKSPDRLVQLAYVTFHVRESNDPMLDAAIRSDDIPLRRIAEFIRSQAEILERAPTTPQ